MSDELFEVAFSGQVSDTADIDNVKARVGKMFNADAAKIAQLFSGKRVVIKKNIDRPTAEKYQNAFAKAGAISEVKSMKSLGSVDIAVTPAATASADAEQANKKTTPVPVQTTPVSAEKTGETDGLIPPQIDPLGITGDQIPDLAATIAPVGSIMHDHSAEIEAPTYDLSGLDVAPVGSQLGASKKEADPPPPDISGISMSD
jgi:hypothetical protein